MTLDAVIMLVGALTALLPFLGFPNSWDTVFFFILGVIMIALGVILRRRDSHHVSPSMGWHQTSRPKKTFVENTPMVDPVNNAGIEVETTRDQ